MAYRIIEEKCVGCGACAWACLFDVPKAKTADGSKYEIDAEKCCGCGQCENLCPNSAIEPRTDHRRIRKVTVEKEKCIGCTVCMHICPEKAPFGERGKPFEIDQGKCTQCGACAMKCRHDAIVVEYLQTRDSRPETQDTDLKSV